MNHVNNGVAFKGWASDGVRFIKDESCPLCGQEFLDDAKDLIGTYQQVFNSEFESFNADIKRQVNQCRNSFVIPNSHEALKLKHQSNVDVFCFYPEIADSSDIVESKVLLDQYFQEIIKTFDNLKIKVEETVLLLMPFLDQKHTIPYESIQKIDFHELVQAANEYNQALNDYQKVIEQINAVLNQFKKSIEPSQLIAEMENMAKNYTETTLLIKRIDLEPLCNSYKQQKLNIDELEATYTQKKNQLEQSQSEHLEKYFDVINKLFSQLGSRNFKINREINHRGKRVIYNLVVKFNDQEIHVDKLHCLFSESDKRALALCIFLAKISLLTNDERMKAIIVLDDPVTSFDDERIALILNKFDEIRKGGIRQLIITTHYKGMAVKTVKKFKGHACAIRLNSGDNQKITSITNEKIMASAHDIAFDKIKAFVEGETNEDIAKDLRVFFEGEIRHRFKKQLKELSVIKDDLGTWISTLKNEAIISHALANRLDAMRDTFNSSMHEIEDGNIENTRMLARDLLDVIYNELTPS